MFLVHDKETEDITQQLLVACRQMNTFDVEEGDHVNFLNHFILPKFSQIDLTKAFGVKRVSCFALDFTGCE